MMNFDIALALDLIGVFFFALSGSLLAARKGFDVVGSLLLGSLVGLGGGTVRDVIINDGPPAAFSNPMYLIPPIAAAVLVFFLYQSVDARGNLLTVFDALGLGLFCVTGTVKAVNAGLNPVSAILLGVTTAVGGGLLRDITANEVPKLFDNRDIYAVPAFVGAGLTTLLLELHVLNLYTGTSTAILVFALRMISWHFHWHVPLAVHRRQRRGAKAS
ncbi:MAG: trimeric intracellular cation channel family protein [Acidobacteria bacterium]|nr:trimeric intracellular cation channel family protein [Acidobacteriota bacterium]